MVATIKLINECDNEELKKIKYKFDQTGSKIIMINNGGWLPYLIIPAFVLVVVALTTSRVYHALSTLRSIILYGGNHRIEDSPINTGLAMR